MGKPLRVLVVEDNPDDAELVLRQLRREGYQTASRVVDSAAAMDAALDNQAWDVVLSDYVMPRFSATDALAVLQRRALDLPFIIVSGAVGEEMAVAAMKAGAHDYVHKDNLARLSAAIDRELRDAAQRQERRALERRILEIAGEEQRRIGMDLHETLGQDLTGIAFLAKVLADKLAARAAPEGEEAAQLGQRINQAIALTRSLAHGLMPVVPSEDGLSTALAALAGHLHKVFGVDCRFVCEKAVRVHDATLAESLYHIAREAAQHAVSNGKVRRLDLGLADFGDRITVTVSDPGPARSNAGTPTAQLHLMNHRARLIGGVLSVQVTPDGGTAVTCTVRH